MVSPRRGSPPPVEARRERCGPWAAGGQRACAGPRAWGWSAEPLASGPPGWRLLPRGPHQSVGGCRRAESLRRRRARAGDAEGGGGAAGSSRGADATAGPECRPVPAPRGGLRLSRPSVFLLIRNVQTRRVRWADASLARGRGGRGQRQHAARGHLGKAAWPGHLRRTPVDSRCRAQRGRGLRAAAFKDFHPQGWIPVCKWKLPSAGGSEPRGAAAGRAGRALQGPQGHQPPRPPLLVSDPSALPHRLV